MDAALRKHCQTRKAALIAERDLYVPDWQQVADYVDPYAGRYLRHKANGPQRLPSRSKVLKGTAARACRTMDAGFMGGHTSKSRPWFVIKVGNLALRENADVKAWCDDVTQRIRDVLAGSNFYSELPHFYHSRHLFGVSALMVNPDAKDKVRFRSRNIGTYAIGLDARGLCDSFWYCFNPTARQIKAMVEAEGGNTNDLPQRVQDALTGHRGDQRFQVESLIEPNPDARPGLQGPQARPFRQVYWIDGTDNDTHGCLMMGGHYQMPVKVSRWNATGSDVYGTSPGLDALPDIKQLAHHQGQKMKLVDKVADPALALPVELRNKGATTNPGERIYVTPMQTAQKVEPIYTPDARAIAEVRSEVQELVEEIEQAFFADLFRMLEFLEDRDRTAYEISERKEEKIAQLGPALEALSDDTLGPTVEFVFDELQRKGEIPDPPQALERQPLVIEYTSVLALAQKAAGLGTIERLIGFAGQVQLLRPNDPSVLDKIDTDQLLDEFHERNGSPARLVRSDDDVMAMRQSRAAEMQQQKMATMAKPIADAAQATKALAETVPQDGSALEALNALGMA